MTSVVCSPLSQHGGVAGMQAVRPVCPTPRAVLAPVL